MDIFSKPIGWIMRPFTSLTQNIPILSIILVLIFCVIYFVLSFYKSRVTCRTAIANGFSIKFKDEFISDASVFDTYLTKIYKVCKTNQILPFVLNFVGIMLFVSAITVLYSPLQSFFGIGDETKSEIVSFMVKNFDCKKNLSDLALLDLINENKEILLSMKLLPNGLDILLNSSVELFGINFIKSASFNSVSIVCPILYLAMYSFSSIMSIVSGIKRKDKLGYILAGVQAFFFILIIGSAFVFPLVYFLFIFIYRILSIIYSLITNKIIDKYKNRLKEELVPKCNTIYELAKDEFLRNSQEKEDSKNNDEIINDKIINDDEDEVINDNKDNDDEVINDDEFDETIFSDSSKKDEN